MAIVISLSFVRSGGTAHDSVERFIECNRRVDIFTTSLHHHAARRTFPLAAAAAAWHVDAAALFYLRRSAAGAAGLSPPRAWVFLQNRHKAVRVGLPSPASTSAPSLDSVMPPRAVDLTAREVVMSSTRIDVKRYNTAQNNSSRRREIDVFGRACHFFTF